MNEIRIKFRCGHTEPLAREAQVDAVACTRCGDRRVANVSAPPPVFRATDCEIRGPLVQEK
jgi:hypothetical protein